MIEGEYVKKISLLFIFLISFLFNIDIVSAGSSNFEPTIFMGSDITEDQVQILMGFKGEQAMALSHKISWDSEYLTFVDIYPLENFVVTKGKIVEDGRYRTIEIVSDSDYAFLDTNYALIIFSVTPKFKKGKNSDVIFYTYEGAAPDKTRMRHVGLVQTLQRTSASEMLYSLKPIDDDVRFKYWLLENYMLLVFGVLIVVALVVFILVLPTRRKNEAREKTVSLQTKGDKLQKFGDLDPIKIDMEKIASMGEEKKEIDMSEAIVVSEYQPFENNPSRKTADDKENIQSFASIVDLANNSEKPVEKVSEEPVLNAFNQQAVLTEETITVTQDTKFDVGANNQVVEANGQDNDDELFHEIKDNPDNLILFQPSEFDNKNDNNKINSFLILLLVVSSLLLPFKVMAEDFLDSIIGGNDESVDTTYDVDGIRNCIVKNVDFDIAYDLNVDDKCDVLDLIYTKDLSNIVLPDDENTSPGFADINGESSIGIGEKKTSSTTTKKGKTTKTTTRKTTTKKNSSSGGSDNKKTTTRKTTTKKTTSKKTTTTTGTEMFNVEVKYNNAKPDVVKQTVAKKTKAYFTFTVDHGYVYDSVTCTNNQSASYSKSSNKLTVKSLTNNTVCTVVFDVRTDMTVKVSGINALSTSAYTVKGEYLKSGSVTIKPKTGYQYKKHSCNKVKATYSGTTFTVTSLTDDDTCTIEFEGIPYDLVIQDESGKTLLTVNTRYSSSTYDFSIVLTNGSYTSARCKTGSTTKTISLSAPTAASGGYKYILPYRVTGNTVCTMR